MQHITKLQLSGLTCSACERVISSRLKTIADVKAVAVQVSSGIATITASRTISNEEVTKVLHNTHYKIIKNL